MRVSNIFVTVDVVVFKKINKETYILFIKRRNEPFKNLWALPGGFVDENEDLETAAKRELVEETFIEVDRMTQLAAFGKPFRDPRQHTVSIAYYVFVEKDVIATAADDAKEAKWFSINKLPDLAFDHIDIVKEALENKEIKKFIKN